MFSPMIRLGLPYIIYILGAGNFVISRLWACSTSNGETAHVHTNIPRVGGKRLSAFLSCIFCNLLALPPAMSQPSVCVYLCVCFWALAFEEATKYLIT